MLLKTGDVEAIDYSQETFEAALDRCFDGVSHCLVRPERSPRPIVELLQLAGLWNIAIAQPVFDILARTRSHGACS